MAGATLGAGPASAETPVTPPPIPVADVAEESPHPTSGAPSNNSPRTFMWLIVSLVGVAALAVLALFGFGVLDDPSDSAAQSPAISSTPTTAAATPTTSAPTPTTVAPAPTTTTSPTTTTTIPDAASLPSVGDPIGASSLKLRSGGIGPIDFGTPADEAIGRLVASLGRPDETGAAGEELGLCPGDEGRFARWAGFTAVVSGPFDGGTFTGYRFNEQAIPTYHLDLATPSGIRLSDSVRQLNETYASYQIDYASSDGTTVFRLSDADGLLLWGPVSSTEDDGRVEGIYSPDSCSS